MGIGDTRTDLSYLLYPIKKATEWYIQSNENIDILFERAIMGLQKLKESYNKELNIVCHSLDLYISIINESLKDKTSYLEELIEDIDEKKKILYLKLKELWNNEQINLIIQLLSQMEKDVIMKNYVQLITF